MARTTLLAILILGLCVASVPAVMAGGPPDERGPPDDVASTQPEDRGRPDDGDRGSLRDHPRWLALIGEL